MKTKSISRSSYLIRGCFAAALLSVTVLFATPARAQARTWPTHFQNSYINNTQQYILIRQDVAQQLALSPGKMITVDGRPKYFVRSDGYAQEGGPLYYLCLFSDVAPPRPPAPSKPTPPVVQNSERLVVNAGFFPTDRRLKPGKKWQTFHTTRQNFARDLQKVKEAMADAGYGYYDGCNFKTDR